MRFKIFIVLILLTNRVGAQLITTVAGNGTAGYSGDNAPADLAKLDHPFSIAIDQQGNYYIADRGNNRIRKVSSGIISSIAGIGSPGFSGDNGPATAASLSDPTGVAIDNSGNVYIADRGNNRIRKIDNSGTITTIAGNGNAGFSGDNGQAAQAELNQPRGVAVDGNGNIYIADQTNQRVRKIASGTITTIAGMGTQGFGGDNGPAVMALLNNPAGICVDQVGNIYIGDVDNERVRKIDNSGNISTIAGNGSIGFSGDNGPATQASLNEPLNLAVDNNGNIFIADGYNERVRRIDAGGTITTLAGTGTAGYTGDGGPASMALLNHPYCVALGPSNDLLIADYNNSVIRRVTNPTEIAIQRAPQYSTVLYPNPCDGNFNLQVVSATYPVECVLINFLALTIDHFTVANKNPSPVSLNLPDGLYLLSVNGSVACIKLVVKR